MLMVRTVKFATDLCFTGESMLGMEDIMLARQASVNRMMPGEREPRAAAVHHKRGHTLCNATEPKENIIKSNIDFKPWSSG